MSKTVFVTGANRGIGLGLTDRFLAAGFDVVAAARNPDGARELWELEHAYPGRCTLVPLDVTSEREIDAAASALSGRRVDILINNAGILPDWDVPFEKVRTDVMMKALDVNMLGPLRVTQRLLPNLAKGTRPVVATVSSKMGSIKDNTSGGSYAYRVSKAAVNMLVKSMAVDHPSMICVALHPGWVQTDMGGSGASTPVPESAKGLYDVITGLEPGDTGKFFDFKGRELPW